MKPEYHDRIIEAFTDLIQHERAPDLDFSEIARRVSVELGTTVAPQTVGKWLRDGVQPRESNTRLAVAAVFNVSVSWLFYGEGAKQPSAKVKREVDSGTVVHPNLHKGDQRKRG